MRTGTAGPPRIAQMLFTSLQCNPRLVATGGFCADHTNQPLYNHILDPRHEFLPPGRSCGCACVRRVRACKARVND